MIGMLWNYQLESRDQPSTMIAAAQQAPPAGAGDVFPVNDFLLDKLDSDESYTRCDLSAKDDVVWVNPALFGHPAPLPLHSFYARFFFCPPKESYSPPGDTGVKKEKRKG
jgi:hypothetical protein